MNVVEKRQAALRAALQAACALVAGGLVHTQLQLSVFRCPCFITSKKSEWQPRIMRLALQLL
jgi:hypothetical protein